MPDTTIFFQKRVGWTRYTFISVFLIINFILNLIVSLPTIPTTWKLSGIRSTSSVESPSVVPGEINQVVEIGIIVGPAGGCMSFGDQRTCAYTMNLQPSAEFWHLPSNQNVTNHFPSGKLMISCHFTTAVQALATTSYLIGPFKPGFFLFSEIFSFLSFAMSIFSGLSIVLVSSQIAYHVKYSIPKFQNSWGIDFVLSFMVVFIQLILAFWVGCIRCKMPIRRYPPPEIQVGDVELQDSR